ncbi:membrane protein [Tersicoccus solisilvae]|uniref:Membrane protein n=1 Tax=Tersicoccus solisilvae TaxID=1882339 RepID=A0ABQ1P9T2_9MICC|nr:DUF4267 domain-containing protein [Tersicoccus solisilvae]GGC93939.1 membrane protein [Tersicoccus solisilvae]
MVIAALVVALLVCVLIVLIGARFIVAPRVAVAGYGVPADSFRALTSIKGVRDIASGIVLVVVLIVAGRQALGWVMVAAAITPIGDAIIVRANHGTLSTALGIHGATAAVLVAAGLVLALG